MQQTDWKSVKDEVLNDRLSRKFITGAKVMVAQLRLAKDCLVPLHHHESEQISMVMQGALKFELEGQAIVAVPDDVVVIPSNVPHSVLALEDSIAIDIFSPIRQDWLDGTDSYLRK